MDEPTRPIVTDEEPLDPRRTPVKVAHLVAGLVLLGISGLWLLDEQGLTGAPSLAVLLPGLLILAGVLGLVAATTNARNRNRGELR